MKVLEPEPVSIRILNFIFIFFVIFAIKLNVLGIDDWLLEIVYSVSDENHHRKRFTIDPTTWTSFYSIYRYKDPNVFSDVLRRLS